MNEFALSLSYSFALEDFKQKIIIFYKSSLRNEQFQHYGG